MAKGKDKKVDDLQNEYAEDIATRAAENFHWRMDRLRGRCESPIEELMALTIFFQIRDYFTDFDSDHGEVHWMLSEYTWPEEAAAPFDGIFAFQQAKLGTYRADFLFFIRDSTRGLKKWVVVECDGHDFHERTKEQAARDRARDRWMTTQDVTVLRFTGSEIWRDPIGVGEQVCSHLHDLYYGKTPRG